MEFRVARLLPAVLSWRYILWRRCTEAGVVFSFASLSIVRRPNKLARVNKRLALPLGQHNKHVFLA